MENNIVKPSTLPGFLEFLPADQILFNNMLDTIRKNYENFGFIPQETPILEKSEVLLAKGGGDTEKQIYRFTKGDTDMSMRFDLTVPLARYVAQNMNELNFPYRRYQIGKVYRGERNQRGRFREFYQCDIDIIGNGKLSIINDAEIPAVIYSTFKDLGFDAFEININNRKILNGFFNAVGIEDKTEVLRTIDKLDKIGIEGVRKELKDRGISEEQLSRIEEFIKLDGATDKVIEDLKNLDITEEEFLEGIAEMEKVVMYIRDFKVPEENFKLNLKIARGLDYYTGTVYETILKDYPSIGSVCSGGRYDNLAGYYTKQKLPGVGISIGLSRLFYQLKEAKIIEAGASTLTEVMIVPMDENISYSISTANKLKGKGIIAQVYFEEGKLAKKLNYANKLGIPYVIIIGSEERESGKLTLKDMAKGDQKSCSIEEVIKLIKG
ncbi:histidine--tRNA ligase [Alloiococcus sp. CFN-8]|uniref:histidine--tRNA ligase n=1 Tax=Alloiococcus sp. CFN-8 TaxID=3416081 RepID=UPI003CFB7103